MERRLFLCLLGVAIGATGPLAQASDSLGFYVGGAVGQATLRVDNAALMTTELIAAAVPTIPFSFSKHATGWKVQVGLRPSSLIGAELEYLDFGNTSASFSGGGVHDFLSYHASADAKAATALGTLYAPLPLPLLDVYAKAGVARLQAKASASGSFGCLADCPLLAGTFYRDQTTTRVAYGAGVQVRLGRFAVRSEYERISVSSGDLGLLSIGAIWSF